MGNITKFKHFLVLFLVSQSVLDASEIGASSTKSKSSKSQSTTQQEKIIPIATFDSGFGGYFSTKEIEAASFEISKNYNVLFNLKHFGDTLNAPYGEKSFEEIAQYSANGILKALNGGAEKVFIACNTASTQFDRIKEILDQKNPGSSKKIVSIIEASVAELKKQIDLRLQDSNFAKVAIMATPATTKAGAYPRALARAYGVKEPELKFESTDVPRWYTAKAKTALMVWGHNTLELPNGKQINLVYMGPGNWVDLIEQGASPDVKKEYIQKDLALFSEKLGLKDRQGSFDVVGEFCTHYPAIDKEISSSGEGLGILNAQTSRIKQGPLVAQLFKDAYMPQISKLKRNQKVEAKRNSEIENFNRAKIYISGTNTKETADLAKSIFPSDPAPLIEQIEFK